MRETGDCRPGPGAPDVLRTGGKLTRGAGDGCDVGCKGEGCRTVGAVPSERMEGCVDEEGIGVAGPEGFGRDVTIGWLIAGGLLRAGADPCLTVSPMPEDGVARSVVVLRCDVIAGPAWKIRGCVSGDLAGVGLIEDSELRWLFGLWGGIRVERIFSSERFTPPAASSDCIGLGLSTGISFE